MTERKNIPNGHKHNVSRIAQQAEFEAKLISIFYLSRTFPELHLRKLIIIESILSWKLPTIHGPTATTDDERYGRGIQTDPDIEGAERITCRNVVNEIGKGQETK